VRQNEADFSVGDAFVKVFVDRFEAS